jgi:hypothetical protein
MRINLRFGKVCASLSLPRRFFEGATLKIAKRARTVHFARQRRRRSA